MCVHIYIYEYKVSAQISNEVQERGMKTWVYYYVDAYVIFMYKNIYIYVSIYAYMHVYMFICIIYACAEISD